MKPLMKLSIAGSTVVCAALLSFGWSEQRGVSLSVESVQAGSTRAAYAYSRGSRYYGNPNNRGGLVGGDDPGTGGGFGRPYYAGVVRPAYSGLGFGFFGLGQPYYTAPHYSPYNPYRADLSGLPWYGVRAYYAGGPWYYGTRGWADYAARDGIVCTPGSIVKGGDGINYVCQ
jgi:hypothetical protein